MALEDTDLRKARAREGRMGGRMGAAGRGPRASLTMLQEGVKAAPGFCYKARQQPSEGKLEK